MTDTPVSNDKNVDIELDSTLNAAPSNNEAEIIHSPDDTILDTQESDSKIEDIFEQSSAIINVKKINKSLKELEKNHTNVAEIKNLINLIIDNMAKNQSMLTRAALIWGKVPLWQKIGLGTVLIAPTLILGIALQIYMLITISALTLIAFIPSSIILDNHYQRDEQITDLLKDSMKDLADSLVNVIQTMNHLGIQLAGEIGKLQNENERLSLIITDLSAKVADLTSQAEKLKVTEQELRAIQQSLEQTDQELKLSLEEKTRRHEEIKKELAEVAQAFEKNQEELSQKTLELKQVQLEMGQQLRNIDTVTLSLQRVIETYADQSIKSEEERQLFQSKLNEFVTNREKSFEDVTQRIESRNHELLLAQEQFAQIRQQYQDLLKRQGNEIKRIEQAIPAQKSSQPASSKPKHDGAEETDVKHATHISKFGLHGGQRKHRRSHHQHKEPASVADTAVGNGR